MKRVLIVAVACAAVSSAAVMAQQQRTPAAQPTQKSMMMASPITEAEHNTYSTYKGYITRSADMMAEKDFAFKPATMPAPDKKEIRNFGEIVMHLADENPRFCAAAGAMAEPKAATAKTKAEMTKALADGFAVCDRVWAGTTDANAATPVDLPFNLGKSTRLAALSFVTAHMSEHYGNLVTYLRAKGMVPPSSQPAK
jgi:uncharacterized damage-inducible protein DinB